MGALMVEMYLEAHNVKLLSKADLWYMRAIGKLMFWNDRFMSSFWTVITLGPIRVIAYPTRYKSRDEALKRPYNIIHEIEHVKQADNSLSFVKNKTVNNIWFAIKYLFLPLPAVGAWFRYDYEVRAYLKGYLARLLGEKRTPSKDELDRWVEWVAAGLWKYYFYTIPPSVTRKRLRAELVDLYSKAE